MPSHTSTLTSSHLVYILIVRLYAQAKGSWLEGDGVSAGVGLAGSTSPEEFVWIWLLSHAAANPLPGCAAPLLRVCHLQPPKGSGKVWAGKKLGGEVSAHESRGQRELNHFLFTCEETFRAFSAAFWAVFKHLSTRCCE